MQSVVGPLIALLGTLVVAALGFYQWRRQNGNPNRGGVAEARRKAAEAIWAKLEELNLELRSPAKDRRADLQALARDLNTVFLQNSLYLDDDTQRLANDYLASLVALARQMDDAEGEAREEWGDTVIGPASALAPEALKSALALLADGRKRVKRALLDAAGA